MPKKEKKKEIEFRVCMRAKIHEAQQFDPIKFRDDYLEDFKYQLIPKTYKGQRLPQWRILVRNAYLPSFVVHFYTSLYF